MALVAATLKKQIESAVYNALMSEFAKESNSDPTSHKRMAKAISAIADVLVDVLTTQAQVSSGIPTAGSPSSQLTTAPGKIL
jgi:hypothetical protein